MYWIKRFLSKFVHLYFQVRAASLKEAGRIYMLHNVGSKEESSFNITSGELEAFIKNKGVDSFVKLEDWESHKKFNCLTVDDVPEEFFYNGYPLLEKYQVPFTIFVASGLLNKPGYITTEQLREMASCKYCTVGSHGIAHGEYSLLSVKDKQMELSESKNVLESILGQKVTLYAFPYGSYYACGYTHKHLVMDYYIYGFGTVQIPVTERRLLPNYYIPRINVSKHNYRNI